jgi:hypothetical protein
MRHPICLFIPEDDHLEAELMCDASDANARAQLDTLCLEHGVERSLIE